MSVLFYGYAGLVALVLGLMALALAGRLGMAARWAVLALAAGLMAAIYVGGAEVLGRPKPVRLALIERAAGEAEVIAALPLEGVAIHLWLLLPGAEAPRAYTLPWSEAAAEALRAAQAEAEANGTRARMRHPFAGGQDDTEAQFVAPPPERLPPKRGG